MIDNSIAGFRLYEFRETDGKVGQKNIIFGDDFTFATVSSATPPVAVTNAASGIGQTDATLNGTADPNGSNTSAWFEYGTNTTYGQTTASVDVGSGGSPVAYHRPVSGLSCGGMNYHFRAVANGAGGTDYGSDRSFTTSACPESNTTPVAEAGTSQAVLAGDTVMLDGHLSSDVDEDPLTFHWSFVSLPAASNAVLDATDPVYPEFIADEAGAYVVRLIVNDSTEDSAPDTVEITAINSTGCSGDVVTISNITIPIGITECIATTSITLGPDVVVVPGAELRLYSPSVSLGEGVTVEMGAVLLVVPIP